MFRLLISVQFFPVIVLVLSVIKFKKQLHRDFWW